MKPGGVLRSTAVVGSCTGLSRALGFVREVLMAAVFGTSLAQSAFVVAFRIPNLFRRLFGEGALSAAFVPVFTQSLEHEGHEKAWGLAGRVFTLLGTVLLTIVAVGVIVATLFLRGVEAGSEAALVLNLLRIMLPYMFFICLVALCMAILNSFNHFLVPAATPILLNVTWIAALVFLCPHFGETPGERIYGVAWGILVAGAVQLAVQLPMLVVYGFRGRLRLGWRDDARVHRVLALMGPAALGMGITQVNVLVDTLLALWVGKWAPAALSFAERLIYLPLGVFATALGTVLLPVLSRHAARVDPDAIRTTLNQSLRGILFVMIPASVGLMVLAFPVVRVVFERGEFDEWSSVLTARALMFYAPGLVVFSLYKVLVPAFYAMEDTRTPVRVASCMVGLNVLLNVSFILTWPTTYKHAGLAMATVISEALNAGILAFLLSRRIGSPGWRTIALSAARILGAALVMALAVLAVHRVATVRFSATWGGRLGALAAAMGVGVAVYAAMAAMLCRQDWCDFKMALRSRHDS